MESHDVPNVRLLVERLLKFSAIVQRLLKRTCVWMSQHVPPKTGRTHLLSMFCHYFLLYYQPVFLLQRLNFGLQLLNFYLHHLKFGHQLLIFVSCVSILVSCVIHCLKCHCLKCCSIKYWSIKFLLFSGCFFCCLGCLLLYLDLFFFSLYFLAGSLFLANLSTLAFALASAFLLLCLSLWYFFHLFIKLFLTLFFFVTIIGF